MEPKDNGSKNLDVGFAFNDINFSDRVLRLEIEQGDKTEFRSTRISFIDLVRFLKLKIKEEEDFESLCNIEVKSIHISSPILAAQSPFFLKLFSNGMKESTERIATLRIHSSEEVALMDLLNYMYNNTLQSATTSSLADVLMVADKFQVSSCIKHCIKLLCDLPMTCESALRFLHPPFSVMMPDEVQPLTDVAKKHISDCYKNFTKFEEEMIKLPLVEIVEILSSDDLQVTSEDVVYDFVLKWARKHYPMMEKRRGILTTQLASLIRFEYMTVLKLKHILTCNEFDPAYASKVVSEALLFKTESTHLHTLHASRTYKLRPVKVLESMFPHPHCIVYFDLKKEQCDHLGPNRRVLSEHFRLQGKWFHLSAIHCTMPRDFFGFYLNMSKKQSGSCSVDFEFSVRSKPTEEFVSGRKLTYTFSAGKGYGYSDLSSISWNQFIDQDSIYFINGVLYLKVEIAMKA